MTKTSVTKAVVRNIVGYTTSFTIANLIRTNLQTPSKLETAEIWVGSVAVGMMVSDMTQKYVDRTIDELAEVWHAIKAKTN